ncbi:MAG: NAD(P)-dependent oxidoreductase [Caulobacteraceae bacterium]
MRVLVTGAGGFLGGAIYQRLAKRGDIEMIAAGRTELGAPPAALAMLALCKPDVVVHAAGRTHGPKPAFYVDNVLSTEVLSRAIGAAAPRCALVLLGSAAQYGPSPDLVPWRESGPCDPSDDYGASKVFAEESAFEEAKRSGIRVTSLRIFNVISPEPHGQQAYPDFLRKLAAAMSGPSPWRVEMGDLSAIRDFVALDDVLRAVECVVERGAWGEAINVCTGVGRPVRGLLDEVSRAIADVTPGLVAMSESGPPPALDWSIGDPTKCQARLGFTPTSDLSALTATSAAWVRKTAAERADA